jgi:hypothetical protein
MNAELAAEHRTLAIQILGINPEAYASGNVEMCAGRDLPWLQESSGVSVASDWGAIFRDVVILDVNNEWVTAYNLTTHDLGVPANYEALKDLLRAAAQLP